MLVWFFSSLIVVFNVLVEFPLLIMTAYFLNKGSPEADVVETSYFWYHFAAVIVGLNVVTMAILVCFHCMICMICTIQKEMDDDEQELSLWQGSENSDQRCFWNCSALITLADLILKIFLLLGLISLYVLNYGRNQLGPEYEIIFFSIIVFCGLKLIYIGFMSLLEGCQYYHYKKENHDVSS